MAAIDVQVTRRMTAPREEIWAVLQDVNRLAAWLAFASAVTDVSSGTAAPGVTYSVKPHKSYEPTTNWTITEVDALNRQLHESEMPMIAGVRSELTLGDAADGAATVSVHWRGEPSKLMAKLMRPLFQSRITKNWEQSLESLDRVAGGSAA